MSVYFFTSFKYLLLFLYALKLVLLQVSFRALFFFQSLILSDVILLLSVKIHLEFHLLHSSPANLTLVLFLHVLMIVSHITCCTVITHISYYFYLMCSFFWRKCMFHLFETILHGIFASSDTVDEDREWTLNF